MRIINQIIVHCSDSPRGRGDGASTIHDWHLARNWDGIGYHYVILEDGTVQVGRPEYWDGAHTRGQNGDSIGICLIGPPNDFTEEQMYSLANLVRDITMRLGIGEVRGHSHYDPNKSCPGFDAEAWWKAVDEAVTDDKPGLTDHRGV